MKLFCFILVINYSLSAQNFEPVNIFYTNESIKRFADYLFCEKDYLRAVSEYKKIVTAESDTIIFKTALALKSIGNYEASQKHFSQIKSFSLLYDYALIEKYSIHYLTEDFNSLRNYQREFDSSSFKKEAKKIFYYSFFSEDIFLFNEEEFSSYFDEDEKDSIKKFYLRKTMPEYKSPVLASILSALLPGAGKIYTENYTDGLFAALITGVLAYLSYDNFKADHQFRGWLFGGLSALFYAGNVYGSAASAKLFNARIDFDFNYDLQLLIKNKNYFLPQYDFICK